MKENAREAEGDPSLKRQTIGAIVRSFHSLFYAQLLAGIAEEARRHDFDVITKLVEDSDVSELKAWRALKNAGCAGIIMNPKKLDAGQLEGIMKSSPRTALLNYSAAKYANQSVRIDNVYGGRMAAEHLIGLGHRHLAMITGPQSYCSAADRSRGFIQAAKEHGLTVQPELIVEGNFKVQSGARAMADLLRAGVPFSAVFVQNDAMAIGAMHACASECISVPEEMSIMGYDDTRLAKLSNPGLTTIRYPIGDAGAKAVQLLAASLSAGAMDTSLHKFNQGLKPSLVERSSVAQAYAPDAHSATLNVHKSAATLTQRERECLQLMAMGATNVLVAEKLAISEHTVNFHLKNSLLKLQAKNRTHAVALALRTEAISANFEDSPTLSSG
jgi:LacI family transcriptional regulator